MEVIVIGLQVNQNRTVQNKIKAANKVSDGLSGNPYMSIVAICPTNVERTSDLKDSTLRSAGQMRIIVGFCHAKSLNWCHPESEKPLMEA